MAAPVVRDVPRLHGIARRHDGDCLRLGLAQWCAGAHFAARPLEMVEKMQAKIETCELRDHGIDHAQYFPGCGTAFTRYENCATGCGSNLSEALDDALEQIASIGHDAESIEDILRAEYGERLDATEPNTDEAHEENEMSEMYYYVSILY